MHRGGKGDGPIHEFDATMPEFTQPADGLNPPKDCSTSFRFRSLT